MTAVRARRSRTSGSYEGQKEPRKKIQLLSPAGETGEVEPELHGDATLSSTEEEDEETLQNLKRKQPERQK